MPDREGNLITIRANSNSITIFNANENSFYSPRGIGNPSPTSVVPGNYKDNVSRFNEGINDVYGRNSDYDQTRPFFSWGFREPYVYTKLTDSNFKKYIKKYDNRAFPIGSTIQDVERLSKMTVSGHGVFWLLKQQMLHLKAPFDETNIVDPTSHLVSAARPASLGFIPRVTKHISNNSLIGTLTGIGSPKSTVGYDALPDTVTIQSGATGLIRGNTATRAKSLLERHWGSQTSNSSGGFLKSLLNSIAPSVGAKQPTNSDYRADEDAYSLMYNESSKLGSSKLSLRGNTPYVTSVNPFESKSKLVNYKAPEDLVYGKDRKGIDGTYSNTVNTNTEENSKLQEFYKSYVRSNGVVPGAASPQSRFNDVAVDRDFIDKLQGKYEEVMGEKRSPRFQNITNLGRVSYYKGVGNQANNAGQTKMQTDEYSFVDDASREKKLGFPNYSVDKSDVENSEARKDRLNKSLPIFAQSKNGITQYDKIIGNKDLDDLIKFRFYISIGNEGFFVIPFRATLKSISENYTADWSDVRYLGRADKVYTYNGFSRNLSYNFTVVANSKGEMKPMWNRINMLTGLVEPSAITSKGESDYKSVNLPPLIKFTIGDMYMKQPCIINSIGVSIPDEYSWEIDDGLQYPMGCEISIDCTILNRNPPELRRNRYGFNNTPTRNESELQTPTDIFSEG